MMLTRGRLAPALDSELLALMFIAVNPEEPVSVMAFG